jgi:hypothetical protein
MPNGHYVRDSASREWVLGVILFPERTVERHVVPLRDLYGG